MGQQTELWTLYPYVNAGARAMLFVDGENLAIRYGSMRSPENAEETERKLNIRYRKNVAAWADHLAPDNKSLPHTSLLRRYYYTSLKGDENARLETIDWLKSGGFEAPRVFRKDGNGRSKQVDITLCCDMLTHAARRHYEVAILVAGDGDYVPLLRAVKSEGARAHVWFISDGLSSDLRREADHFVCLDQDFGV